MYVVEWAANLMRNAMLRPRFDYGKSGQKEGLFHAIPDEIIVLIMGKMDCNGAMRLAMTCRDGMRLMRQRASSRHIVTADNYTGAVLHRAYLWLDPGSPKFHTNMCCHYELSTKNDLCRLQVLWDQYAFVRMFYCDGVSGMKIFTCDIEKSELAEDGMKLQIFPEVGVVEVRIPHRNIRASLKCATLECYSIYWDMDGGNGPCSKSAEICIDTNENSMWVKLDYDNQRDHVSSRWYYGSDVLEGEDGIRLFGEYTDVPRNASILNKVDFGKVSTHTDVITPQEMIISLIECLFKIESLEPALRSTLHLQKVLEADLANPHRKQPEFNNDALGTI
jgi:hypothetical protein